MIELLSQSIAKQPSSPGFLIDGFPANMNQVLLLGNKLNYHFYFKYIKAEIFISKIQAPHKIIFLDVPEAVMGPRLKDGVNFNDSDETIKKRVFTFMEQTKPTIDAILKKWKMITKTVIRNKAVL